MLSRLRAGRMWAIGLLVSLVAGGVLVRFSAGMAARSAWARTAAEPGASVGAAPATTTIPAGRVVVAGPGDRAVQVYPPIGTAAGPLVVMLHGACGQPISTCDYWSRAGREGSWLVCPTGNALGSRACQRAARGRGKHFDWQGYAQHKASYLEGALAAVRKAYEPHIAKEGADILIGFSRGAFMARDVAYAQPGRWVGLVLLGADLHPDPGRLMASGIRRVVMAAGDHDGAARAMQRAAARLDAAGLPTRYLSLGPIYHQLPADLEPTMREALGWIRGSSGASAATASAAASPRRGSPASG